MGFILIWFVLVGDGYGSSSEGWVFSGDDG